MTASQRLERLRAQSGRTSTDERLQAWRADPVLFAKEALGVEPWVLQAEVMMAVACHHRVAVKAGRKVGKSLLVACLALWWACTREHAKVLITAPTGAQIKDITWYEIQRLVLAARKLGVVDIPEPALDPGTGLRWRDGRLIVGRSTDRPERIQGYSGPACLYLIDEASGVAPEIVDALEGNAAGGSDGEDGAVAKFVLTGNPTQTSGAFFEAFHQHRSDWTAYTISSELTPNAQTGQNLIPGLATADWIAKRARAWGATGDLYRVHVEGKFPKGGMGVVPLHLVDEAQKRDRSGIDHDRQLKLGVDVARFGDDFSVTTAIRGKAHVDTVAVNGFDEYAVTGIVVAQAKRLRMPGDPLPIVNVDGCGVGIGVASLLRQAKTDNGDPLLDVHEVNAADASDRPDEFPNVRSQLWFDLADWLADGAAIDPDDNELAGDLVAPTYSFDAKGRRVVEKKESFKKRLGRSPDRADALALAVHQPVQCGEVHVPSETSEGFRYGSSRGF